MNYNNTCNSFGKQIHPSYGIENYKLNYRAVIPFYVLLDKELSGNEKTLYGLIEQMESSKGIVTYKNETLCRILGISEKSNMLKKMTRNLKSKGYIKRERIEVMINGKKRKLWCWSTEKKGGLITDETLDGGTSDTPQGGTSDTPQGGTSDTPSNSHNSNSHNSNSLSSAHARDEQNPDSSQPVDHNMQTESQALATKDDLNALMNPLNANDWPWFKKFWELYPRQDNHNKALSQWIHDGCEHIGEKIINDIQERIKRDKDFIDGCPLASTNYIRKKKWETKIFEGKKTKRTAEDNLKSVDWANPYA